MSLTVATNRTLLERIEALEKAVTGDGLICIDYQKKVYLIAGSGVPTDGTSGTGLNVCGISSTYFDFTNGNIYIQTGAITSPVWKLVTRAGA